MKFNVYEDNGGGLSLFVFRGKQVIYAHDAYEYNVGQLSNDIAALVEGDDTSTWEGNVENRHKWYNYLSDSEYGAQLVAEGRKGVLKLYEDRMGRAAQIEFGLDGDY